MQHYTDWREFTAGAAPAGWTPFNPVRTWTVVEDGESPSGVALRAPAWASGNPDAISLDAAGSAADVEVYVSFRVGAQTNPAAVARLQGSGARWYADQYSGGAHGELWHYDGGSGYSGPGAFATGSFAGLRIGVRYQVQGTTHRYRVWDLDATAEPGTWALETVQPSLTSAGLVGLGHTGASDGAQATIHAVGIGTDGDAAPTAAPGFLFLDGVEVVVVEFARLPDETGGKRVRTLSGQRRGSALWTARGWTARVYCADDAAADALRALADDASPRWCAGYGLPSGGVSCHVECTADAYDRARDDWYRTLSLTLREAL
ncbi:MAG: hypothetical protein JWM27_4738 [Gemmatimonadetes bacterium]|nr:hypothetical protein [Gemmatimonadota bacterium]